MGSTWYTLTYRTSFNKAMEHSFSGTPETVREILARYGVQSQDVLLFEVNGSVADLNETIKEGMEHDV